MGNCTNTKTPVLTGKHIAMQVEAKETSAVGVVSRTTACESMVVCELFTSQGCSSCPPADAQLKELARSNASVLALSWHVDYWNYLGFPDPYSNATFAERQRGYSSAMRRSNIFTPELIVQGGVSVVGSDSRKVRQALQSARPSQLGVEFVKHGLNLDVKIQSLLPAVNCEVLLLYLQRNGRNKVTAGECRGETLESINIVRAATTIQTMKSSDGASFVVDLRRKHSEADAVAVIVQLIGFGKIIGAGVVDL